MSVVEPPVYPTVGFVSDRALEHYYGAYRCYVAYKCLSAVGLEGYAAVGGCEVTRGMLCAALGSGGFGAVEACSATGPAVGQSCDGACGGSGSGGGSSAVRGGGAPAGGAGTVFAAAKVELGTGSPRLAGQGVANLGGTGELRHVVAGALSRGPNNARNREARARRKQAKLDRAKEADERDSELSKLRGGLERMRLERQLAKEENLLARRKTGLDHVAEAVALAKQAVECEKLAGCARVAGVAGWAATVVSSSAGSVARSAPASIPSIASVRSAGELALLNVPFNALEKGLQSSGWKKEAVVDARKRAGRPLVVEDLAAAGFPGGLTAAVKRRLACLAVGAPLPVDCEGGLY